ncbi:DUF4112 domain-containing protein [Nisaea sp.]|uniref:DUF4112 domain-containing protein n=1 Tax=Nisaea sp. TaxID=2024842 RepID=UPI0032EE302D
MTDRKPVDGRSVPSAIELDREIERLDTLADWMDSRFRVPGTDFRFGLDAVAGLVPGVGDGATALLSLYIVIQARRMGAPLSLRIRMTGNVIADLLIGSIPLVGDVFDAGFKVNRRNVALLRKHLADAGSDPGAGAPQSSRGQG